MGGGCVCVIKIIYSKVKDRVYRHRITVHGQFNRTWTEWVFVERRVGGLMREGVEIIYSKRTLVILIANQTTYATYRSFLSRYLYRDR